MKTDPRNRAWSLGGSTEEIGSMLEVRRGGEWRPTTEGERNRISLSLFFSLIDNCLNWLNRSWYLIIESWHSSPVRKL